jgi:hypothetical protein
MTKEQVYDDEISPLMAQIIDICKRHKIAMLADFCLDAKEGLKCTTSLLDDEYEHTPEMKEALRYVRPRASVPVMTIKTYDENGDVIRIDRVV